VHTNKYFRILTSPRVIESLGILVYSTRTKFLVPEFQLISIKKSKYEFECNQNYYLLTLIFVKVKQKQQKSNISPRLEKVHQPFYFEIYST